MNQAKTRPENEQEVFQRVWQRVMGDRPEDSSPIRTDPPPRVDGDMSTDYIKALSRAMPAGRPADRPGSDMPVPGLERSCPEGITAHLRQQTLEALEAWQFYRYLARRARGSAAQTLAALAADQHQLARRLSTAYFLHSGVRYWPVEQLAAPVISTYWGALRRQHQEEQQAGLSYRMAADETEDSTLRELYGQLEERSQAHCRKLRTLLEQSCP